MWSRLGIGCRLHRVKDIVMLGFDNGSFMNSTVKACLVKCEEDRPMVLHCMCMPDDTSQLIDKLPQLSGDKSHLTDRISQLTADESQLTAAQLIEAQLTE